MKSMTGYGRASAPLDGRTVTVQVSSVNRRTLDLTVAIPGAWESLEPAIGEGVRKVATRGKVHVDIEVQAASSSDEPDWNEGAIRAALGKLSALAASEGVPFKPTPDLLWQIANATRTTAELPAAADAEALIRKTLAEALHGFSVMRAKEGESLLVDFLARAESLHKLVEAIATRAPRVPEAYRELLFKRLRELGIELDLADERVLKEIALFADRCDVSEEVTRFRSHLDQFSSLLRSDGEIGRKAEFILQEMGREAHTMGSKANDLAVSRNVIELKNELERVKEQIANVE